MLTKEAIEILYGHRWGGNVRELDNVIKGAYAVCDGLEIAPSDLPNKLREELKEHYFAEALTAGPYAQKRGNRVSEEYSYTQRQEERLEEVHATGSMKEYLSSIEKELILSAYEKFHSVRKAADYLGMSMPTYVRKRLDYLNGLN